MKEFEGLIEKEFTIVMYADKKFNDKNLPEYYNILVGEGLSAKCPPDIFGEQVLSIPNDSKMILENIQKYAS
jgi:hypothetical protein